MNAQAIASQVFEDNWPIRRRWLGLALIWLAINVDVLLFWKGVDALTLQVVVTMIGAIFALITAYVFGAVLDDKDKRRRLSSIPAAPDAPATDEP